jgi:hypothetical protein
VPLLLALALYVWPVGALMTSGLVMIYAGYPAPFVGGAVTAKPGTGSFDGANISDVVPVMDGRTNHEIGDYTAQRGLKLN